MAIVPMKRVTFVTLSQKGDELLRLLQRLKVLHPEHIKDEATLGSLDDLRHMLNVQASLIRAIDLIEAPEPEDVPGEEEPTFAKVKLLLGKLADLDETMKSRRRERAGLVPWGDFDPDDIAWLREEGVDVRFWRMDAPKFEGLKLPRGVLIMEAAREMGSVLFVTVAHGIEVGIPGADEVSLADERLADLEADIERIEVERRGVLRRIGETKARLDVLRKEQELQEHEYDYRVAVLRAFDDGDVKAFAGWIPADRVDAVRGEMGRFEVPVVMDARDPLTEECPPVLTRNYSIAKIMEPLLRLLGVPNYRGLDPALFFAPFMMLFFGICLGDVGYGISMIIGALILKRIFRNDAARVAGNITVLFGIASIIVGVLTGQLFGIAPFGRSWIPIDISFDHGDPMILFRISIALGIIHLTIAFLLAALSEPHWQAKLAKAGSVSLLWGGALLVVGISLWWVLMAAGLIILLLFFSDSKNPFKRLGLGLWGIYNHVSLLGDVMSYSRLFGLGIATGAIASVVNTLATDARGAVGSPGLGFLLSLVVLVVGHLFNLAMGIISALVHPARLHAVEALPKFVKFTGVEYKPLVGD